MGDVPDTGAGATMTGLDGRGASTEASSAVSDSGIQSLKPERQHRLSGPTSPRSQSSFTFSTVSGPTCFSSMATYHSCEAALDFASSFAGSASASASLRTLSVVASRAAASPADSPAGILCVPELSTWSKTAPISSSSTVREEAALGRRAERRGHVGGGRLRLLASADSGREAGRRGLRRGVLRGRCARGAHDDGVAALLATNLDPLGANLVVANHVLRAAAVADETHRFP